MKTKIVFFSFFVVLFLAGFSFAEEDIGLDSRYEKKVKNLEQLIESINYLSSRVEKEQKILQSSQGIGREKDLREEITGLGTKLAELESTFSRLCTGVDHGNLQAQEKNEIDWKEQAKELLGPAINQLKQVTARPREIEQLRTDISVYQERIPVAKKAIESIDQLLPYAKTEQLKGKLQSTKKAWQNTLGETRTKLNIASSRLDEMLFDKKPLSESVRELVQMFFRSRGRNLLVSFFVLLTSIMLFQWGHKLVQRYSPVHKKGRTFGSRIFDIAYIIASVVITLLAVLAVFYFFGDWLLLSIVIIFLIGVGWASKQAIPIFWEQAKLLLNFGPVREGEVIVYNGIPFEVISINFFSIFKNSKLSAETLRLPLKDLLEIRSRPIAKHEPWFPCRSGEWVILADGTYGEVLVQTPESVKVRLKGGGVETFRTEEFLKLNPLNLSKGYRLWVTFGLDYSHIDNITDEIPQILEKALAEGLNQKGYAESIRMIRVEFEEVGTSSMDLSILADFNSQAQDAYYRLCRLLNRICLETGNKNDWSIPYQQVKIHLNNRPGIS